MEGGRDREREGRRDREGEKEGGRGDREKERGREGRDTHLYYPVTVVGFFAESCGYDQMFREEVTISH